MSEDVRARIGFTSVAYVTEVVPKAFYEIAPKGVLLTLLTTQLTRSTPEEMQRIHQETLSHARAFARARCNVIFLGGAPTNLAHGWEHLRRMLGELEQEFGVPVTSNATAQHRALVALGASKVGIVHPYSDATHGRHDKQLLEVGLTPVGDIGADAIVEDYHLIPKRKAFDLGVALKRRHPELDTLLFACPHWNVVDAIEPLEQELGINVVASLQAIVWEGIRLAKIDDRIAGFGRLMREH